MSNIDRIGPKLGLKQNGELNSNTFKPEFLDEEANGNLNALKLNAFRLSQLYIVAYSNQQCIFTKLFTTRKILKMEKTTR